MMSLYWRWIMGILKIIQYSHLPLAWIGKERTVNKDSSSFSTVVYSLSQRDCWLTLAMKPVRACSVVSDSLQPLGLQSSSFLCAWDFPDKMLEWLPLSFPVIFLIQRWNLSVLHLLCWHVDSLPLDHLGSSNCTVT